MPYIGMQYKVTQHATNVNKSTSAHIHNAYHWTVVKVMIVTTVETLDGHPPQPSLFSLSHRVNPEWLHVHLTISLSAFSQVLLYQ